MLQHTVPPSARRAHLLSFVLLGASTAALYAIMLLRFPLLQIYATPIQNLDKLTGSDWSIGLVLSGCIVLLFAIYGLGMLLAHRPERWGRVLIVALPLVFVALLFWTYPTTSIDVYDYLFRGRLSARYRMNTFVSVPLDFFRDPLFGFVAWRRAVTAYGPIWEWMSWITARLAGESPSARVSNGVEGLLPLMLAYKALAVLGFALCGGALWLALGRIAPEQRWFGLYLWLWNPLALWETAAAGHNDAWMALLIVLALYAAAALWTPPLHTPRTRTLIALGIASLLALTVGGLIKYLAFCFGPVLLAAALRRLPTWRQRAVLFVVGGGACVGLVVASYAPFWVGTATLRNFSDRGALFTATWLAAAQALLEGPMGKAGSQTFAASLGLGLFAGGILWASVRAWLQPEQVVRHVLGLLLWFLFVCSPWFQPWYLLWALAVVALRPADTRLVVVVIVFCCTALLSYVAGSFLLPALQWDGSGAAWNGLMSAMIYGPPLLVWAFGAGTHAREQRRNMAHVADQDVGRQGAV